MPIHTSAIQAFLTKWETTLGSRARPTGWVVGAGAVVITTMMFDNTPENRAALTKELPDLLYVTYWLAARIGVDLNEASRLVHESNAGFPLEVIDRKHDSLCRDMAEIRSLFNVEVVSL